MRFQRRSESVDLILRRTELYLSQINCAFGFQINREVETARAERMRRKLYYQPVNPVNCVHIPLPGKLATVTD